MCMKSEMTFTLELDDDKKTTSFETSPNKTSKIQNEKIDVVSSGKNGGYAYLSEGALVVDVKE